MNIIVLRTSNMPEAPGSIITEFICRETIRSTAGQLIDGEVTILYGEEEDIKDYLRPHSPVWTSNNPMVGGWECLEVLP